MSQKVIQDIQMGDVKGSITVPSVVQYVAATVKVGKVEETDEATVENVGTPQHAILDFDIPKGAYKTAVDGGYTGTQEEFNEDLGNFKNLTEQAQQSAQTATQKATEAAQSANQAQASETAAEQSAQTATEKATEAAQSAEAAAEAAQNLSHATETTYGITRIATSSEATAGTNKEAYITPLTAKEILNTHSSLKNNPHSVTKEQVGLGNADNTSDANKPVSGPQQTALNLKADKTYVDGELATKADLVDGTVPTAQIPALPYLPTSGGSLTGDIVLRKYKGVITTMLPPVDYGFTRLQIISKDPNYAELDVINTVGTCSFYVDNVGNAVVSSTKKVNLKTGEGYSANVNGNKIIDESDKAVAGGVASLGSDGKVPAAQLPETVLPDNYDYVVDSYTDESGNWYRVYKSGWVEQGGIWTTISDSWQTVTFMKPYSSVLGVILSNSNSNGVQPTADALGSKNVTNTNFQIWVDSSAVSRYWEAYGQGAE